MLLSSIRSNCPVLHKLYSIFFNELHNYLDYLKKRIEQFVNYWITLQMIKYVYFKLCKYSM